LKNLYGGTANIKQVADALAHLRKNQMINYRKGTGRRGSYNILIHKHLGRTGALKGFRLNAFADNSLRHPLYEWPNGGRTEHGVSSDGGQTVYRLSADGAGSEDVHHQKIQEIQECQSVRVLQFKTSKNRVGEEGEGEPPNTPVLPESISAADAGVSTGSSLSGSEEEVLDSVQYEFPVKFTDNLSGDESDAEVLANRLFLSLNKPKRYGDSFAAWTAEFEAILNEFDYEDIAAAMNFGFTVDDFWPEKLFMAAGKDPCEYFITKLPTILAKYQGRKVSTENAARKTSTKEKTQSDKQTRPGKTGKTKTDGNSDAVAETIQWLRQTQPSE
jgi:hypothetical protein